jgi:arylsulfatase A-like enzyme
VSRVDRRQFLLASALASGLASCRRKNARPDVLLVSLDTTRRDRLGIFGSKRDTSPSLDALAAESVAFTRAVAASSWTLPSHASIFTGKFPSSHGARYDPEGPLRLTQAIEGPESWEQYRARGLAPSEKTLAGILRGAGYRTAAVAGGPWLKRPFGLDTGFDTYDDAGIGDVNGRLAVEVTGAALKWLSEAPEDPFFLFLNYFDPHGPYEAPTPFGGTFGDEPSDRYDEEILYMDHHIGRLLDGMKGRGRFDDCLVLVTADHGELLGEHGKMGHGVSLFEEEIRVPLLVKYPGSEGAGTKHDVPVHHVDLLPLILERLGLVVPQGVQGEAPRLPASGRFRRPLLAEVDPLPFMSSEGAWRALYLGRQKFLWNSLGHHALYDLESDPGEENDLAKSEPARAASALRALEGYLRALPPPGDAGPARALDEDTVRALRSLGYVP